MNRCHAVAGRALGEEVAPAHWHGWSSAGHYVITRGSAENPPRQGCRWLPAEDFDLLDAVTAGVPLDVLADRHGRTGGALHARLDMGRALAGATKYMREGCSQ